MKKRIALIIYLCLALLHAQAQDITRISLDTLLQRIETNYPAILQYQQNMQSWQAKAQGAKSWMPPTFSTGVMNFPYNLSMVKEKNDPMNWAGIAFSIEQMIPNQTKLNAKRDYINSLAEVEKSKSDWTKNELRREAKILYYNRFINQQKQKTVSESEEVLNLLLTTAEAKFSSNQSQLQTLYKAKARLAELKNMQYMLSGLIAESNIGLNILMVRDVNTHFEIDTLIQPRNYSLATTDTANITNRSDITALSKYIQSMKLEQKVMKVGVRPDFGVRAQHMQMLGMPSQWSIMGMMTIPIVPWSSKMYSSEVKSMGFQIQSMELEKQTMQLMATKMFTEKLTMLRYENGQYQNYSQQIIPAYENNMQANLLAFKQNTGDLFVLLDAWEMLLMKKMEMYDRLFNILKLEAEYEYETEIR
jgi:outer membrane protein TolC